MAEVSWSFEDLFGKIYGFKPKQPDFKFDAVLKNQYSQIGSPFTAKDMFGRDYYLPVKLGDIELPYPVLRISGKKRIVETSLVNRTGTVKELISMEDYDIEIRGLIVSKDNSFPFEQMMQLRDLYKAQTAFSISSALTDLFLCQPETGGSDQVVIYDLEFPEVKGILNVRPYFMKLKSDAPFELVKTVTG